MSKQQRPRGEVVLYHGSLAELNSRNPNRQYEFARDLSFMHVKGAFDESLEDGMRKSGYDGLVNFTETGETGERTTQGTPIVRKKYSPKTKKCNKP